MTLTTEDATQWIAENAEQLDADRLACEDSSVRMMNAVIPDVSQRLWNASCWLGHVCKELGATDEQVSQMQFSAGQRAFYGDVLPVVVSYANAFAESLQVSEQPGAELAEKLVAEFESRRPGDSN